MIDLHTHTTASDGTCSPAQLIEAAGAAGLRVLAITDHDTLAGSDEAAPYSAAAGVSLISGIEISVKLVASGSSKQKTVHLLGYFGNGGPSDDFRHWVKTVQDYRKERNVRLIASLRSKGIDIQIEEVEAIGRSMTARPHFARIMVEKGYVKTIQEAFDEYLDEAGKAFVFHETIPVEEGIQRVVDGGGVPSLAHPVRIGRDAVREEELVRRLRDEGLGAVEVFHSDHTPEDVDRLLALARRYGLAATGGSDFHGDTKPDILLGTGRNGNVSVPDWVTQRLFTRA